VISYKVYAHFVVFAEVSSSWMSYIHGTDF